ncbi:ent-kaurene oxidase [Stachybotrys elegans]|uniref:Ent-kaurene oxidase n=1 Tax=Stachybotrys elegans TaxID=80388 RepID=A0A8K0SJ51_9HYPO|nr:ent-kaurene oxidase [Stachybotrys elegans]
MNPTTWQSALQSALPKPATDAGILSQGLDTPQVMGLTLCAVAVVAYLLKTTNSDSKKFPVANPPKPFDLVGTALREDFERNAGEHIEKGLRLFPGKPFKIAADFGEATILPHSWAHDIRNEPKLSFMKVVHQDFHADFPAFKPFASGTSDDALLQSVARNQLTKHLNKVTMPLSAEANFALDLTYGAPTVWKEFQLKDTLLDIIARLSSCVFLGAKLCRNEAWLHITKTYTTNAFLASEELRMYPIWLRGIMHRFSPRCRLTLETIVQAREIVSQVIEERRALTMQGKYTPSNTDAIDWFEEAAAGRPYDPTLCQMILSTAAIHTTTDLANETLLRLAQHPELVNEVRQELIQVLSKDGWKKTSLYNMKLLDACLNESQRLRCAPTWPLASMMRMATGDVRLPDGSVLQKGEWTFVSSAGMSDPAFYEDPDKFDPYRFIRLREEPGKENQAHLVSTSPYHLGFGHGKHSCPGRFFAANELKVLLCHVIMKYDFMLPEGYVPTACKTGYQVQSDPQARILLRARQPEIDIDSLFD